MKSIPNEIHSDITIYSIINAVNRALKNQTPYNHLHLAPVRRCFLILGSLCCEIALHRNQQQIILWQIQLKSNLYSVIARLEMIDQIFKSLHHPLFFFRFVFHFWPITSVFTYVNQFDEIYVCAIAFWYLRLRKKIVRHERTYILKENKLKKNEKKWRLIIVFLEYNIHLLSISSDESIISYHFEQRRWQTKYEKWREKKTSTFITHCFLLLHFFFFSLWKVNTWANNKFSELN